MTKKDMQAAFDLQATTFRALINKSIERQAWDDAISWTDCLFGAYSFAVKLGLCDEAAAHDETIRYRLLVHDARYKELLG